MKTASQEKSSSAGIRGTGTGGPSGGGDRRRGVAMARAREGCPTAPLAGGPGLRTAPRTPTLYLRSRAVHGLVRSRDPHRSRCAGRRGARELLAALVRHAHAPDPAACSRNRAGAPRVLERRSQDTPPERSHHGRCRLREEGLFDRSAPCQAPVGRATGVGPPSRPRARPGTRSTSRGPGGDQARALFERSEFARAPRPAAAAAEAGRPRAAGGEGGPPTGSAPFPPPPLPGGSPSPGFPTLALPAFERRP